MFVRFFFFAVNLSIAFVKDDQLELYKPRGYDRPVYLVVHFCFFFQLGLVNHIFGGQMGAGSNIESYREKS